MRHTILRPFLLGVALTMMLAACGGGDEVPATAAADTLAVEDTSDAFVGEGMTILQVLKTEDRFSTLRSLFDRAGMAERLGEEGPFTLFAPTNEAFNALPEGTIEQLSKPENLSDLETVLMNHAYFGVLSADALRSQRSVETMSGNVLSINATGATLKLDGAAVTQVGVQAGNGVIHVIDQVLVPQDVEL